MTSSATTVSTASFPRLLVSFRDQRGCLEARGLDILASLPKLYKINSRYGRSVGTAARALRLFVFMADGAAPPTTAKGQSEKLDGPVTYRHVDNPLPVRSQPPPISDTRFRWNLVSINSINSNFYTIYV
ncbi:hypothetical protein EVAR_79554_1 [Eumeta japonica]|uniref:Uncharacterized protein n=1 Tax=Eumeta variegata TaxID=151549 RepID=A0A4C1UF16_EUMVA|nr:hypothetical protein EVAR_79554_1 [Eumeta japonica]